MTTEAWPDAELTALAAAVELEISTRRDDGSWRDYLPIWVVSANSRIFVRTWYRRDTGWFGRAMSSGRARVRVPGVEREVRVVDVGVSEAREAVDDAYREKYRAGADRMVADDAAAATLRLDPL